MAERPTSLEQIQRWMQSVIMHPGGVEVGTTSGDAREHLCVDPDKISSVIAPSQALSSAERLDIYARAYYARLIECLRAEYPMLLRAIGEDLFDQFAIDFLQRYPSTSYTLSHLGTKFPQYLRETRPAAGETESWPDFLIDLAELEWLYSEVFDGPGIEKVAPLDAAVLQQLSNEHWSTTRLAPAPCLRLVSLDYPVHTYYRRLKKNEEAQPPTKRATLLAITRRDYIVRPLELDAAEHELLVLLVEGKCLGEAIETVASRCEDFEELTGKLRSWFARWMSERFFIDVVVVG
jgi:hypothetical protein